MGARQASLEITDADRAQSALELAAWQAEQRGLIDAERARIWKESDQAVSLVNGRK